MQMKTFMIYLWREVELDVTQGKHKIHNPFLLSSPGRGCCRPTPETPQAKVQLTEIRTTERQEILDANLLTLQTW